ncbi:MAG: hypothetical protein A2W31_00995 [Planctomycetes bacterium RBG_16_64_10]|nr:MAG: hypothetical protein A2W31_00995 [Planctomycetes bacterium RBG_16_64_10]
MPAPPGISLVPLFTRDHELARDDLWWLHEGNRASRLGDWKLVAAKDQPWELYQLSTDRAETRNLAAQYPNKVRELERLWMGRLNEVRQLATSDQAVNKGTVNKEE